MIAFERSLLLNRKRGESFYMCQVEGTLEPWYESQGRFAVFRSQGRILLLFPVGENSDENASEFNGF